jgi:predicted amidohydrolase
MVCARYRDRPPYRYHQDKKEIGRSCIIDIDGITVADSGYNGSMAEAIIEPGRRRLGGESLGMSEEDCRRALENELKKQSAALAPLRKNISISKDKKYLRRQIKIVTVKMTNQQPVERILEIMPRAKSEGADIVCFPELALNGIETVPGPGSEKVALKAKELGIYTIAGIVEHDLKTDKKHNTSFICDPKANIIGKYRKTFLTVPEINEMGLSPGDSFPVFETDFGRIAIKICYDHYFPEVDRIYALKGAEIIFWPTWAGGPSERMLNSSEKGRCIENGVYIAYSCCSWLKNFIISQRGYTLSSEQPVPGLNEVKFSVAQIDLGAKSNWEYGGSFRTDILNMRRPELYSCYKTGSFGVSSHLTIGQ